MYVSTTFYTEQKKKETSHTFLLKYKLLDIATYLYHLSDIRQPNALFHQLSQIYPTPQTMKNV